MFSVYSQYKPMSPTPSNRLRHCGFYSVKMGEEFLFLSKVGASICLRDHPFLLFLSPKHAFLSTPLKTFSSLDQSYWHAHLHTHLLSFFPSPGPAQPLPFFPVE